MNILVTGATGYFGAAIVKNLLTNPKNRVTVLVRDENKFLKLRQWCSTDNRLISFIGNVCSIDELPDGITTIVHAAGIIESTADVRKEDYIKINSECTANILKLAKKHKTRQFIFISTQLVYGSENAPWSEGDDIRPYGLYASTKYDAEKYIQLYGSSLDFLILRMARIYGASLFMRWNELIPRLCTLIYEQKSIPVYGDGNQRYDMVHIDDASKVIDVLLANYPTGWNDVYNIGGGRSITLNEIINEIVILSKNIGIKHAEIKRYPDKIDDRPKHLEMDISKIQSITGWRPTVSFSRGLEGYFKILKQRDKYKIYF
jgi:dTDP-glucose 4,6-dehydratase